MTVKLNLIVNDTMIHTDYFVQGFIDHVASGIIEALEGTGKITDLDLSIDGEQTVLNLNGNRIALNAFTAGIIKNTIIGMVSSLKEVNNIKNVHIFLHK